MSVTPASAHALTMPSVSSMFCSTEHQASICEECLEERQITACPDAINEKGTKGGQEDIRRAYKGYGLLKEDVLLLGCCKLDPFQMYGCGERYVDSVHIGRIQHFLITVPT